MMKRSTAARKLESLFSRVIARSERELAREQARREKTDKKLMRKLERNLLKARKNAKLS